MNQQDTDKANNQLIQAVKCGALDSIKSALKNGADINTKDGRGNTSLYIAAHAGNKKIVSQLIELGADTNLVNNYGGTALTNLYNKEENRREIAKELIMAGADYNILPDALKEDYGEAISEVKAKTAKINKIIRQKKQKNFRDFARSRMNRNR